MGKDQDPWQLRSFDCANNAGPPTALAKPSTNLMMFPNYADPHGVYNMNSTVMPCANSSGFNSGQRTFMIFDQSGDRRSLLFSSFGTRLHYPNASNSGYKLGKPVSNAGLCLDLQASNETDASANKEMHEDSEEIDALLYSDSDNDCEEEEETSTGHSPIETATGSFDEEEDVASSAVMEPIAPPPAKRRRTEPELDPLLADTASSAYNADCKKAKRERIQETVGVLRRIIPGGKGKKDAAAVLDEAIQYLKSLRLKAKGLAAPSLK